MGITDNQSSDWQKLARIPEPEFEARLATAGAVHERLTTAVLAGKPHVAQNAGENEWYTPPEIIEAARLALGTIDLDPASHEDAQAAIKAGRYFTREQDGLSKPWKGTVWLNPPYSQPDIGSFCGKLLAEIGQGHTMAAITLTNNATETEWAQALLRDASAVCFPAGRVKFWAPNRTAVPLQGQMLCYFGEGWQAFRKAFLPFGRVWR